MSVFYKQNEMVSTSNTCLGVIIGVLQAVAVWANSEMHREEKV